MITQLDMKMLHKLSKGVMAAPVMDDDDIVRVQRLVTMGLARDFAAFHGRRTEVRLRIWGITDAGRAVLEQRHMATLALEPIPRMNARESDTVVKNKK